MKRRAKAILSLFCALLLMMQFAGPVASADNTSSVSGDAALICAVYLPSPDQEGSLVQVTDGNRQELLGGKSESVTLDGQALSASTEGGQQLQSLLNGSLRVVPPEGFRVSGLFLTAADAPQCSVQLPADAAFPSGEESADTVLNLNGETLQDQDGRLAAEFVSANAAGDAPVYMLAVCLEALDASRSIRVRYDLNGVPGEIGDASLQPGGSLSAPALTEQQQNDAAAAGKVFDSWELRYGNGSHVSVQPAEDIAPYADCVLTARWKEALTVTANAPVQNSEGGFEANGFQLSGTLQSGDRLDDDSVTLSVQEAEDGKYFVSPSAAQIQDENGRSANGRYVINYVPSAAVSPAAPLVSPNADTTTYTVSFDANGHGTAPEAQSVESGSVATQPAAPSEDGWTFGGWFRDLDDETAFDFSTPITGDLTLHAKWTAVPPAATRYTVSFDANGHGTAPEAQSVESGSTATQPAALTDDGWTFGGWFLDLDDESAFDFSTPITGDLTLHAKWTAVPPAATRYTVSFDANGHGTAPEAQSVESGSVATQPAALTDDDYNFVGWFRNLDDETAFDFTTPITGDLTLHAKWAEKPDDTLTPTTINLTIDAVTASKTYDGSPLKAADYNENGYTNGYKLTGTGEGHTVTGLQVSGEATVPGTPVPTKVDYSKMKVTDGNGQDVTDRYVVTANDGSLTISKRSLVLTAISTSVEYNGQTIKASEQKKSGFSDGFSIGGDGLVTGQTLSAITVNGEGKDAKKYPTSIADPAQITVSNGNEDVTDCYEISTVAGELTITQHSVTITAISGTVTATGNTIYAKGYSGNGYTHGYKAEGLLDGHSLQGDFVTGSGKDADFDTNIDKFKVQIVDAKKNDVTANYKINTVAGKMKVKAKEASQTPITVTASASKVYDATPLTISNSNIKVTQGTLPSNYTLEASFGPTTSITDVQKISVSLSNVKVKDASGKDVTDQFKITTVSGTMEVTKKPLTLTAESATKTYDGKALINKNVRATALASKDHDLSVEYEITNSDGNVIKTGAVNVGTYTKRITTVTIKEGSKDVTSNYAITKVDGKLTITAGTTKKNDASQPKTGDESNLGLWLGILIASAVLVILIILVLVLRARKGKAGKPAKPAKQKRPPKE